MEAPDKIFVREYPDGFARFWEEKKKDDVVATIPHEYIRKDALLEWIKSEMERLWELLPDADNDNPTQMELRYLGQYMQMESLEDKLNSL